MTTAYCVKEKSSQQMKGEKEVTLKNGRKALKGTCASCGGTLFKFIKG